MTDYDWEDFTRRSMPQPERPLATLQKHGIFSINGAARALLGDADVPIQVILRFDRARNSIGMTRAPENTVHAYPVRQQRVDSTTWVIAAQAFCRHFGVPIGYSRRYTVQFAEGPTLVVDLNGPELPALSGRGRTNGRTREE